MFTIATDKLPSDFKIDLDLVIGPGLTLTKESESFGWFGLEFDQTLTGGQDDDLLEGGEQQDLIRGFDSNDTLEGFGGTDYLEGGEDDDLLNGGSGNDTLIGDLEGLRFAKQDNVVISFPKEYDGGFLYWPASGRGQGNDILNGGEGNDTLDGGGGNDTILGGEGEDLLFGGTSLSKPEISSKDGSGNDYLDGGAGNDELVGAGGSDTLIGGTGEDHLLGSDGRDRLDGSDGNDTLAGQQGYDTLIGGSGADDFHLSFPFITYLGSLPSNAEIDTVEDYNAAEGDQLIIYAPSYIKVDQFQYNSETGSLSYEGQQFAQLPTGLDFVPQQDLVLNLYPSNFWNYIEPVPVVAEPIVVTGGTLSQLASLELAS